MWWLSLIFAVIVPGADAISLAPSAAIRVERPWIRLMPPAAQVMAAYAELRNEGAEAIVLVKAESEAFGAIEIHETYEENGVMRMRRLAELPIPAGASVELKPGGLHLMLFRPTAALAEGAEVPIRLHLSDGQALEVRFPVRADPPTAQGSADNDRSAR